MELPIHGLPLFVAAGLLLNLTPGPDMLFVAGAGAAQGRRAGVLAALGVGAGCLVHVALAALGLSALLAATPWAHAAVTWVGAGYLVWIGVSMLRAAPATAAPAAPPPQRRIFWQGALTNALNPKVALFFLAFLPQFIAAGQPRQALAFVVLGLLFTASGTLVNGVVGVLAGTASTHWRGRPGPARRWLQRAAGVLFVGLGLRLAFGPR